MVYLLHGQFLPEKRLAALLADLFGVQVSTATIAAMSQNCAARFESFATATNSVSQKDDLRPTERICP